MSNIQVYNNLNFNEMQVAAGTIAKSGLFKEWNSTEKVMTLMMVARSEGVDPLTAMNRYDMIDGRLSKRPQAMLADFISQGGKVQWIESTDKTAKAEFVAPNGAKHIEQFTIQDADRAELTKKTNWKRYPVAMLRARCISAGLRAVYPSSTNLLYTPEEVMDFDDQPKQYTRKAKIEKIIEEATVQPIEPMIEAIEPEQETIVEGAPVDYFQIVGQLPRDKYLGFLKSIKFINESDLELTEKRRADILAKFESFKEKVLAFEVA